MASTDLRFVSMGFGTLLQCNMIWGVMRLKTEQSKTILRQAKEEGRWLDLTARRATKSIILLTNDVVATSPFSVSAIYGRIKDVTRNNDIILSDATERQLAMKKRRELAQLEEEDDYEEDEEDRKIKDRALVDLDSEDE